MYANDCKYEINNNKGALIKLKNQIAVSFVCVKYELHLNII